MIKIKTKRDGIELFPVYDVHYGHENFDKELFENHLKWAREEKEYEVYLFTGGDLVESSIIGSPGLFDQESFIEHQRQKIIEYLKPFAERKRLLGMITGNHEYRITKNTGLDLTKIFTETLNVPYYKYAMYEQIQLNNQLYTIYAKHGYSGARSDGGKLNVLMQMEKEADADLYVTGHTHTKLNITKLRYFFNNGKQQVKEIVYMNAGCYLKYWGSYGQMRGYQPNVLGAGKIKLHADRHKITVRQ